MGKNQTYKNRALQSLEGKWMNGCVATLIVAVIGFVVGQTSTLFMSDNVSIGFNSVWSLLSLPLLWGSIVYF